MHRRVTLQMLKTGLVGCLVLAAAQMPALAQQPLSGNPDDMTEVNAFTPASVRQILSSFGTAITIADRQTPEGRPFVEASFGLEGAGALDMKGRRRLHGALERDLVLRLVGGALQRLAVVLDRLVPLAVRNVGVYPFEAGPDRAVDLVQRDAAGELDRS